MFLSPGFVITVRQGVASELRGARARLERRPELLESGSDNIGSLGTFLVFGVGALVIPCVALLVWFRMTARRRALVITSSDAPMAEAIPD